MLWHLNLVCCVMHVYVALLRRNLVCRKKKEKAQRINCKSVSHKCYPNAAVLQFAVINSFALSFVDILLCTLYHSHWDISSSYPTPLSPSSPDPCRSNLLRWFFLLDVVATLLFVVELEKNFRWTLCDTTQRWISPVRAILTENYFLHLGSVFDSTISSMLKF